MASLIVVIAVAGLVGITAGIFISISFAIRRDDWALARGLDAPDRAARSARVMTGYSRRL